MKLLALRLHCPGTLGDVGLSFADEDGSPRPLTLIFGGPGAGKTTLLAAIGNTRPAHTVPLTTRASDPRCYAECSWALGMDQPDSERVLVLSSPNAPEAFSRVGGAERREAAFVERLSREGGFACVLFSALRWFSKGAVHVRAPERAVSRYELRSRETLDDAARHDLAPEVKQSLAYAAIVRALPGSEEERHEHLGDAMASVVDALAGVTSWRYRGLDPRTLEARFEDDRGVSCHFDALPTQVKHCIAFGALTVRALWSAYPGIDPRRAEGVVAIDEVDLHLDAETADAVMSVLGQQLPEVQWIFTTRTSPLLAARDPREVLALRKLEIGGSVSVHVGPDAQSH